MTCDVFESSIVELARGVRLPLATEAVVKSHLQICDGCAARLQSERELTNGIREIAQQAAHLKPAADLEDRLLEAFARMHDPAAKGWNVSRTWLAAAAALLVAAGAGVWTAATLERANLRTVADESPAAREFLDGFVVLPVAAGLPPLESGVIVRVQVPVSALPKYGVEVVSDTSKGEIQADLLVGQDGQPRAIRFVTTEGSTDPFGSRSRP